MLCLVGGRRVCEEGSRVSAMGLAYRVTEVVVVLAAGSCRNKACVLVCSV